MVRATQAYRQTEAASRSPLELVVMLYDGALRFVGEARTAHASARLAARGQAITRALAIVGELQSTLDMERGGPLARELDRLYLYMQERLLDVSVKKDPAALDEVHRLLSTLRDGWAQISNGPVHPQAAG